MGKGSYRMVGSKHLSLRVAVLDLNGRMAPNCNAQELTEVKVCTPVFGSPEGRTRNYLGMSSKAS